MGLVRFGVLSIDGTKVRAKASKRKAMSYDRMLQEEARLGEEIEGLLAAATRIDDDEDRRFGTEDRGDELPEELRRREQRLLAIREAKGRLEAAQRRADDDRGRKPGSGRASRGRKPYKRNYGAPDPKAQSNFTDPENRTMKTSAEGFQQCYNAQTVVDDANQMVVATAVGSGASDQGQMLPLLDSVAEGFGATPEEVLADAGYCREEGLLRSGALRGMWRWGARGRSGLRRIGRDGRRRIGWGKS